MAEARSAKSRPKEMRGQITPDGIARMRARVGILAPRPKPFNTVASEDSIRHYCYGYGEDNPLHTDPDYGATTRWGSVVAPPAYMTTCGIVNAKPIPPDVREKGRGALSGVPNYLSGNSWEFYRPIHPGDVITRRFYLSKVEEKETSFGGKSAVVHHKNEYVNQHGELTGVLMNYFFHVEREASEKKGKNLTIDDPAYDEAYLAKIDEAYANEYVRGAEPRYWEDVAEGERLPSIVRGPLCVTDIICWHIGNGFGQFNVGPLRAAYRNRVKAPNFYTHNEYGAWDAAQRVHWDPIRAKRIGNPRPYDYGRMRTQWMMQLVGNWAGDDGWLFPPLRPDPQVQLHRRYVMGPTARSSASASTASTASSTSRSGSRTSAARSPHRGQASVAPPLTRSRPGNRPWRDRRLRAGGDGYGLLGGRGVGT